MRDRVVITGMGWATPLGLGIDEVWEGLLAGRCAIGPVDRFPAESFATNFGAQVPAFDPTAYIADWEPHRTAQPHVRYLLAAAAQAWKEAGLGDLSVAGERNAGSASLDPTRLGLYTGSGEGAADVVRLSLASLGAWDSEKNQVNYKAFGELALRHFDRDEEIEQEPHRALTHLAEAFGARGPSLNCMTACAASTQSVGEAARLVMRGDADIMIAGGSHSMLHPLGMTGFIRLTAMSTRRDDPQTAARPFDATRDGFVMGEGAGALILESADHAMERGATPLAEIVGYGSSADAYRITDIQPEGRGAIVAMRQACRDAGIDPTKPDAQGRPPVQYISAHGTGTQENDSIETVAVKAVFGDQAKRIPCSSIKSMIGHLIQAAGAVELMTCVQAIRTGFVPPTINLHQPDPRCDLDYVPNVARDMRLLGGVDVALSNGFGFGGQNDCILIRRFRAN